MRNTKGYNLLIIIITILLSISVILPIQSCKAPEISFGKLTISENIDNETGSPINPKNEFDIELKGIWSTISVTNVKGEDNYRFKYINEETEEIISDYAGKYSEIFGEEEGYFEGICADHFYQTEQTFPFLEPGNYAVEFYHQGELISSAPLKIKIPDIEIVEVTLSREIDEKYEALEPVNEFEPDESIYACVKLDCTVKENTLAAKWYFEGGEPIYEEEMEFPDNIYESVNYTLFITPQEDDVLLPGNYYVEIYLNESLHERYDFLVGKNVPINIVSFNLYDREGFQSENINNTFGEALYRVDLQGWCAYEYNLDKWTSIAVYIFSMSPKVNITGGPDLILYTRPDLIYIDTGKKAMDVDRQDYPDATIDVAESGDMYEINKHGREFLILIDECTRGCKNHCFESLSLSVFTEYKTEEFETVKEEPEYTEETASEKEEDSSFDYSQMNAERDFLDKVYSLLVNEYEPAVNHMNFYGGENFVFNDPQNIALEETFLAKLQELANKLESFSFPSSYNDHRNNLLNIANEMVRIDKMMIESMKKNDFDNYTNHLNNFNAKHTSLHDYYNSMSDEYNRKYL
jgi:hypothetical protein